ncbi:hypothetical protein ACWFR1_21925 [Streptomyces sp. NPDC055103]
MALSDRRIVLRRDPHSGEVLAHDGDPEAHSLLQRTGFVHVIRQHERYHRAPTGLHQAAEDTLATKAVTALRSAGYAVECDEAFDTEERTAHYLPLGAQVASLADVLREATTTEDATAILTELTAAHDGIFAALADVLSATEDFFDSLGIQDDRHTAAVLRGLNDHHLAIVATQIHRLRNELADRHEAHPARQPCPSEVSAHEREASAHCPCPTITLPPRLPAPPPARRL